MEVLAQSFCRYGPGKAYLNSYDLFPGVMVTVNGKSQFGNYLSVTPPDVTRSCWVSSSSLDLPAEMPSLSVWPVTLPHSDDTSVPTGVQATRSGDIVTITWDQIHVNMEDGRGYLIDASVCQNGVRIQYAVQTNSTTYDFTDQSNCSGTSQGKIYAVNVRGYTDPVEIPWP